MDPYIHATSSRGEGFGIDDIGNIDEYAQQQAQIDEALGAKRGWRHKGRRILQLLKKIFK